MNEKADTLTGTPNPTAAAVRRTHRMGSTCIRDLRGPFA